MHVRTIQRFVSVRIRANLLLVSRVATQSVLPTLSERELHLLCVIHNLFPEEAIMIAKKILCPIDFSELSILGLKQAAKIAKANQAELIVMHVSADFFRADKSNEYYTDSLNSFMDQIQQLRRVVRELYDVKSTAFHCLGSPASEIVNHAKKESCDLIVIGSQVRKGLSKLVFGSVADKVINRAETNLMIVKEGDNLNLNSSATLAGPIVIPFDFSNAAALTLDFANDLVGQPADLYCVHVAEPAPLFDVEGFSRQKRESVIRNENRDRFYSEINMDRSLEINFRTFFDYDIAKRIKQFSEDIQARLVVVPANRKNFLERFFLGSASKSIAQTAPCPTLILKNIQAGESRKSAQAAKHDISLRIAH